MVRQKAAHHRIVRKLQVEGFSNQAGRLRLQRNSVLSKSQYHKAESQFGRCGRDKHHECPAPGVTCHKCGKTSVLTALVSSVSASDPAEENANFLGAVNLGEETSWSVNKLMGAVVTFKMDTRAEVTAINVETYRLALTQESCRSCALLVHSFWTPRSFTVHHVRH